LAQRILPRLYSKCFSFRADKPSRFLKPGRFVPEETE
jgi:hypothetical protein